MVKHYGRILSSTFALWLLISCAPTRRHHEDLTLVKKDWTQEDIPWAQNNHADGMNHRYGGSLAELMRETSESKPNGLSENNIFTEREATIQLSASMPWAMPFYCNPACYEASIILGLQACQPYRFAVWYYYQYLPPDADLTGRRPLYYCRGR